MDPISQTQQAQAEGLDAAPPADIFISYASDAGEWVGKIRDLLLRPGSQVDSAPVDDDDVSLEQRRARGSFGYAAVVVLITPGYVQARRTDVAAFIQNGGPIVPIFGIHLQRAAYRGLAWLPISDVLPLGGGAVLEAGAPDEVIARIAGEIRAEIGRTGWRKEIAAATRQVESAQEAGVLLDQLLARYPAFGSVTAVIRRAAEYAAAGRPPAELSTSLVLLTFAEMGTAGIAPVWAGDWLRGQLGAAFDKVRGGYFEEKRIPFETRPGGQPGGLREELALALGRAHDLARRTSTTGDDQIRARHLLVALLSDPRPQAGSVKQLRRAGLEPAALLRELYDFVLGYGDDDAAWGEILLGTVRREERLSGFDADDSRSDDYLGVRADVQAFAKLIAARTVTPPLSIGLFGEWGSGKTFFMRLLQKEVRKLAGSMDGKGMMQRDLPYWKRIIQIEFNAWHYVEGNLWASLVQHIFDNLRFADDPPLSVSQELQKHLLKGIGHERQAEAQARREKDAAERQVADARDAVSRARQACETTARDLAALSRKNLLADVPVPAIRTEVTPALKALGLDGVGGSALELRAALGEARALLGRGRAIAAPLLYGDDKLRRRRWQYLLLALFAGPAAALAAGALLNAIGAEGLKAIGAWSVGAAGLLSSGAAWIRAQITTAGGWIQKVEDAQRQLDQTVARTQAQTVRQMREAEERLRLRETDYQAARRREEEAHRRVAQAQQRLAEASLAGVLTTFIEDRANSTDYRKHLGTLALVRNDFERLSDLIEEENWRLSPDVPDEDTTRRALPRFASLEEEQRDRARRINRIVLYIDDLDRCPPAKVVEVLQAVHLLLAFPLFVVVVGVDARWVVRSVETRYRELLRTGDDTEKPGRTVDEFQTLFGTATAHDYLEKIFQVPFWLRSMTDRACQAMVHGLLASSMEPTAPPDSNTGATPPASPANAGPPPPDAAPGPVDERSSAEPGATDDAEVRAGTGPLAAATGGAKPVDRNDAPPADAGEAAPDADGAAGRSATGDDAEGLSPEALLIHPDEVTAIETLAPLLGRSPRALKRFVNVYRLIKAGLTPYQRPGWGTRPAFLSDNALPDFHAVLFLLAVDTGAPAAAPAIFRAILELSAPLFFRVPEEMRLTQRDVTSNRPDGSIPTLKDLVERLDNDPEARNEPDWARVRQWLVVGEDRYRLPGDLGRLGRWVATVSRYSFHTGRMAGPQKQDATPEPPTPAPRKQRMGTKRR